MARAIIVCTCHGLMLSGDDTCRVTDQACGYEFSYDEDRAKERRL